MGQGIAIEMPLSALPGLGTQPFQNAPGDPQVQILP